MQDMKRTPPEVIELCISVLNDKSHDADDVCDRLKLGLKVAVRVRNRRLGAAVRIQ